MTVMKDVSKIMREKVDFLNRARRAYEQEDKEIISNFEYDRLYDELKRLEEETGIVFSDSPTVNVGYEIVSQLPKEQHSEPVLSLDKTKEPAALSLWLGSQEGLLSWKLDGLTIVLTYEGGHFTKAVTRGDGQTGEVITSNARTFKNMPIKIAYGGRLVLRGEAVIKYSDFEKTNAGIEDIDARYKNPRNLCSGTVRQLDSRVTASRNVNFFAFALVEMDPDLERHALREEQLRWLTKQGFDVVESRKVTSASIEDEVRRFAEDIKENDVPSDGLVLIYNDIAYGQTLGSTAKFPRDSLAFKWRDELKETTLKEIEWSTSRTGQINPIAIFTPVELERTMVKRASLHNVSFMKQLELGIGDRITVYKANMIIPQIAENLTKSGGIAIPDRCPVCGSFTKFRDDNGVQVLTCPNPDCFAKQIKSLVHFTGRNAFDIEGISESTIEKLVDIGYIKDFADIFRLARYRDKIIKMDGFGEKSYDKMINAVNEARLTTCARLLYGLGVDGIGSANAKLIAKAADYDWKKIENMTEKDLTEIDGIGDVMAENFVKYFKDDKNRARISEILKEVTFNDERYGPENADLLAGKTFVITGKLYAFENRDQLKEYIDALGGKTAGSVSSKTTYLLNNDIDSSSSKNKKAKELAVEIITEKQFIEKWGGNGGNDA